MKPIRQLLIVLFILFAFVLPGNGCGPFTTEMVFVLRTRPDIRYADYVKGHIGVPQSNYRVRHLIIAYNWLNGHGLSPSEQQQAIAVDLFLNPVSGSPPSTQDEANRNTPWASVVTDREVPNQSYSTFANCLDDAFLTAAETLKSRTAAHSTDTASLADWSQGQQAVFSNCAAVGPLPAPASANSPLWLQQDRAYQLAAAKFYQTDYDGAIAQLRTIVADLHSPWRDTARLVIARAMIRKATINSPTGLDLGDSSIAGIPYSQKSYEAFQRLQKARDIKQAASFSEAKDQLQGILADPKMQPFHASALRLLDFVMLRLDPVEQARILSARLTAANRPLSSPLFKQGLIDFRYLPRVPSTGKSYSLTDWLSAMTIANYQYPDDSSDISTSFLKELDAQKAQAAQLALDGWRSTRQNAWLIAALATAQPESPSIPELVQAASALPQSSPAWPAATYHRMRLTLDQPATLAELNSLPPALANSPSRSTINLFTILRQRTAPTLAAFLQNAGTVPTASLWDIDSGDDPGPLDTKPLQVRLCQDSGSPATTRLFDHDASTILNTRLPISTLADAAETQALAKNLRFQIAQATWTRAVLLNKPEIAKRMSPILIGCYAAWKPSLDKLNAATTADDRRAEALLALMRFASTEPIVRDGEQRDEGFAAYSMYRDNWWTESQTATPAKRIGNTTQMTQPTQQTFFGLRPATPAELPDPPFITATNRSQAEQEIAQLRTIPCASNYFAQAALDWQKQHPTDPRTPDILGFAERAIRNGCRTDATAELNHRLFTIVQTKYPTSEGAKKYKTWE